MSPDQLREKEWYWVRKANGSIVPHRLSRVLWIDQSGTIAESGGVADEDRSTKNEGKIVDESDVHENEYGMSAIKAEMYVGSMIQTFLVSQILGPAEMPSTLGGAPGE